MRTTDHVHRQRGAALSSTAAAAVLLAGSAFAEAPVERLIIAVNPPPTETNLFWQRISDRSPAMQALVGHDPVTGAYDNSELAREWYPNDDFTEWTFHLHENAYFHHDWGPVTAEDVVHSYELHTVPESTLAGVGALRAKEVEAIDDHTVVFRFDEARVDYPFALAGRGSLEIYSKAQYEAEGVEGYEQRLAGTAPYQFVERRIGEGVLFERAPDQWQGIVPDFPEIEIRYAPEQATKLAMLLAGEAHIADIARELQADALAGGKKIVGSQNPAMQTAVNLSGLYLRSGDPAHNPDLPWADVRIREAMNRAVNREEMIDILYDGRAVPIARWTMHATHEGFVPELYGRFEAAYGYDPERAKELLAEAGYPDAFPDPSILLVPTVQVGNPEYGTMVELLQVYFEEIGLQTEVREMDRAALGALGRGRQAYLVTPTRNSPIRPTEAALVNYFTTEGTPYGGYESDFTEEKVTELVRTTDPDARHRLAAEIFTYLFENYVDIPVAALHFEVTVDPEMVADWTFPGVTSAGISHFHLIEAVKD